MFPICKQHDSIADFVFSNVVYIEFGTVPATEYMSIEYMWNECNTSESNSHRNSQGNKHWPLSIDVDTDT